MRPDRDLDRELGDLGRRAEYPATPDLAGSVRGRLEAESEYSVPPARTGPQLWWIAAALVLLVALPGLAVFLTTTGGSLFGASGGASGGVAVEEGAGPAGSSAEPAKEIAGPVASAGGASEGEAQESLQIGGQAGATAKPNVPVPDVVGMELTAACERLASREYVGYVTGTVDGGRARPGRVVGQSPRAGGRGSVGGAVDLTVSEPYPEDELRRLSRGKDPACLDVTQ